MKSKSQFSWTQKDFQMAGEDIPESLVLDDFHTEGELMNRDAVDEWLANTSTTFCLIRQSDDTGFERLFAEYEADLDYLGSIGKLEADEVAALKNKELFKFELQE